MVKSKSALLALIHQHLLKNGYGKSARELQIESGEKFATSKVTLRRVYKLWMKKSKKKKKAKKKIGGKKSKKAVIALQAKKSSAIKGNKAKKMNLATETDVKVTPKKASPSLNDKPGAAGTLAAAVLPDGNDSSDSEEGTASAKAALVQGAEQNDESSSSDSEEETAKQVRSKTLRTTAAAKQKASRQKAEMSDTSESSDETDIDNPEKTSMAAKGVEALPTKPSKAQSKETTAAQARALPLKAQRSSQILASETESDSEEEKRPATVVPSSQPKTLSVGIKKSPEVAPKSTLKSSQPADESSTEGSSESDQEPAAKKQATVLQSSQLQMPMVATKQTSVVAKSRSPLKTTQPASESSEEESESDEEPAAKKPATLLNSSQPKTPAGGAKQAPALDKSKGVLKATHPADESSEEESDSDEEPTAKKPATAVQSCQTKIPTMADKQTSTLKIPLKVEPPDSDSSEEESDGDKKSAAKKPATALQSTQPKTPSGGSKQTAAIAKSKTPVKTPQLDSETSEEDSESDEEPASKKPATVLPSTPTPKTSSGGSKQMAVMAKSKPTVKTPQPHSESSEEDSESDDEPASKEPATRLPLTLPKTPSEGSKQTAAMAKSKSPVKAPQPRSESSEEDSESDEEPASKKPATDLPSTPTPKTSIGRSKQTAAMAKSRSPVKAPQPDSESSEEDSESDEEPASKKPAAAFSLGQPKNPSEGSKQTAAMAKSNTPVKTPQPDSESSEEVSESDEEPASKKPAAAFPLVQPKTFSGGSKQTAAMAKSKSPVKAPQPRSESSEEDSESDEEPASKKPATALPSTPTPRTSSGGSKQTAVIAKSKSPVKTLQPDSESSEEDSESDEEPASKKPAAAFPLAQPKITSRGSKQTAAMAKSITPVKTPQPDSESLEDSESDEEPASKKPATALPSTQTPMTSIRGSKQTAAMTKSKSPVKTTQPDSESSEEDSESDKKLASKKSATALPSAEQKNFSGESKLTAVMAKSKTAVKIEPPDRESSEEDFESDEEPSSMVTSALLKATPPAAKFTVQPAVGAKRKAGGPTKPVPSTKLATADQETLDSSESSDGLEEHTGAQVNTSIPTAVKTVQPKVSAKMKTPSVRSPVPGKTNASSLQKPKQPDPKSSSESSDSEAEPAVKKVATPATVKVKQGKSGKVVKTPLAPNPLSGNTNGTNMAKTPLRARAEGSSDTSESEEDAAEKVPNKGPSKAAEQPVKSPLPSTEVKGKTRSLTQSPAVQKPATASSSSSESEEEPAIKVTSSAGKTQKKPELTVRLTKLKLTLPAKSPVVTKPDDRSDEASSDSEDDLPVQKVATPATVKVKQGKPGKVVKTPLAPNPLSGNTNGTNMAKTPLRACAESSSDTSESEEDAAEKVPNKGPSKAAEQPVKSPLPSTEVKGKTRSLTQSPAVQKPATASSSSSESEEEPAIKVTSSAGKTQKKPELTVRLTKLKFPLPAKSPVVTKPDDCSDEASSDSEDDLPVQGKGDATRSLASSQRSVGESVSKMSSIDVKKNKSAVPPTLSGGCKPGDSQLLLKITPSTITSPKRRRRASEKASILDSISEKTKKNKVQPDTIPEPPTIEPLPPASKGALLESEEETVLALLEGRSPKKTLKRKASKKAADTAIVNVTTAPVQNINVPKKGPLPQSLSPSTWIPESPTSGDDGSALPTKELLPLSDKKSKSSKKRKISEDDLKNQKQTPAKKAKDKKEKKSQKGSVEGANVTPKPKADKKKSEKDQSKKKTKSKEGKKNEEEKKKAKSVAPAVVESTDSGIGLSIPKKKRKK